MPFFSSIFVVGFEHFHEVALFCYFQGFRLRFLTFWRHANRNRNFVFLGNFCARSTCLIVCAMRGAQLAKRRAASKVIKLEMIFFNIKSPKDLIDNGIENDRRQSMGKVKTKTIDQSIGPPRNMVNQGINTIDQDPISKGQ